MKKNTRLPEIRTNNRAKFEKAIVSSVREKNSAPDPLNCRPSGRAVTRGKKSAFSSSRSFVGDYLATVRERRVSAFHCEIFETRRGPREGCRRTATRVKAIACASPGKFFAN